MLCIQFKSQDRTGATNETKMTCRVDSLEYYRMSDFDLVSLGPIFCSNTPLGLTEGPL